jgi:hypothetical protein
VTNVQPQVQREPDARVTRPDGKVVDIFVTEGEKGGVFARGILDGREVLGGAGPSIEQVLYTIGVDLGDRELIRNNSSSHAPGLRK